LTTGSGRLAGRRILVVEDNFIVAELAEATLKAEGAEIVGPAGTVKDALAFALGKERIDGAVLDINLRGERVYPVADVLRSRGVAIVFLTGYDERDVVPRFADLACLQKPLNSEQLLQALLTQLSCHQFPA
jgi:CheY-like chemotaxis protein